MKKLTCGEMQKIHGGDFWEWSDCMMITQRMGFTRIQSRLICFPLLF